MLTGVVARCTRMVMVNTSRLALAALVLLRSPHSPSPDSNRCKAAFRGYRRAASSCGEEVEDQQSVAAIAGSSQASLNNPAPTVLFSRNARADALFETASSRAHATIIRRKCSRHGSSPARRPGLHARHQGAPPRAHQRIRNTDGLPHRILRSRVTEIGMNSQWRQ